MRITCLNQKGGTGKSTVVLLLAAVMRRAGYDVAIEDTDPQGSARRYAKYCDVPLFDPAAPAKYVLTDTPGNIVLNPETWPASGRLIAASDKLLLVTEKGPMAVDATKPMAELIVKHRRPDAPAYVLFNRVRGGTEIGDQSGAELAATLGFPPLAAELPLATAFEKLPVMGLAAVRGKLRDDVLSLALEVMK